ncbi:hypothetical protein F4779DRAFT_112101 [Xylariaceae sp. FL0662B]|nr:hypothetical protein F4779DRAFT_112101 [Xylariaceae sp. FL0662B]
MGAEAAKTLTGKVVLVTGSSRGIGAAIVTKLASQGADVVVNYVASASAAETVAENARKLGVRAITVKADVSKAEEIARLFQTAKRELGRIDIVMSNAGIEHFGNLEEVKQEEFDRVFAVNVRGQFFVAQQAHKYLEDGGRLVLMSSVTAQWGRKNHAIYSASKAAIQGMTKSLAWDFGSRGITVNCVAPGGVATDMSAAAGPHYFSDAGSMSAEEMSARLNEMSPFGRMGMPDDVAGVVALLVAPEAQWLTGQTIHPSGGAYMA